MTLQQAILAADSYDTGIRAARELNEAEQQKRLQGFSGLLPQINLTGGYSKQDQPKAAYAAGVTRHNYSINLSQPIFDIEKYATWRRAEAMADQGQINYMLMQQQLITDVSEAWFSVAYASQALKNAERTRNAFQQQLRQARRGLELGEQTRLEVDEALANYDNAAVEIIIAENDLNNARIRFTKITGLPGDTVPLNNMECFVSPQLPDLKKVKIHSNQNNLNVQLARFTLDQSKADVIASTSNHLPVVTLQAAYGNNWSRGENENDFDFLFGTTSKTRNTNIGINVSIPIFAGGGHIAQSIEAAHRKEQSRELLLDAQRKALEEAERAWYAIIANDAKIRALQKSIASAKKRLESTTYGKQIGQRTVLDMLNAESDYYKSLKELAKARYDYITANIQLAKATGELDYAYLTKFSCST
ncbi:TPA: anibiotic ABC transporter [Citrobacter rodentium]|nr:anibiotic ABC transporter [Citrobacter rodentium NBRC 105723 = DSM 16636]HAT8018165.1 anibiotic ABC transporter [Citrobacter rodentium]HAT8028280.1 anibiotic ABC transporter [Citrobacter rodentium]HAT8033454.1 anibiotic ABC transporter [Citrobacter rodentium]HAT8037783.1 anibiotic ABC transporter [Citrobacter rodentium]